MEEWSLFFTILALAGVFLTLFGAWRMVRGMRGRRAARSQKQSDTSGPIR
ncbi:MAG TPA: hypothetical protein VF210_08590 [Pseudomonadales bacterium]